MMIAALLPTPSVARLRRLIPRHELSLAASWKELDSLISEGVEVGLFDPTVHGFFNIGEAAEVIRKHSAARLIAYVRPTPQNLHAVFRLSKVGLQQVFVCQGTQCDTELANALERAGGNRIAFDLLASIESKLTHLTPRLSGALGDLFSRPRRYETAADLAHQAEIPVKQLYREFSQAGLRTPKEVVVLAKAIHAYGYLHFSQSPERLVRKKLGYSDSRCFLRHVASIFDCCPDQLRTHPDSDEVLVTLLEWMTKPACLRRVCAGRKKNGSKRRAATVFPKDPQNTKRHLPP